MTEPFKIALLGAGWFGREMGWYAAGQPAGFLGALLGAIAILALLRLVSGKR